MKPNKIYMDKHGNRVLVICGDYTDLNRDIVYCQFIDRVDKPITKAQYVKAIKNNTQPHFTFAVWGFEMEEYELLS